MIGSFRNAIKHYFFENNENDNVVREQRKRKRPFEESVAHSMVGDPDVEIIAVKKPKLEVKEEPGSGLFTGFLSSSTVKHMSEWVRNGLPLSKLFHKKKKETEVVPSRINTTRGLPVFTPAYSDGIGGDAAMPDLTGAYSVHGQRETSQGKDLYRRPNGKSFSRSFHTAVQRRPALHPAGTQSQAVQTDRPPDALRKGPKFSSIPSLRRSTAAESIRLDEKWRYHQLIQGFTTVQLKNPTVPPPDSVKSTVSKPALTKFFFDSNDSILGHRPSRDETHSRSFLPEKDTIASAKMKVRPRQLESNLQNGHVEKPFDVVDLTDISPIQDSKPKFPHTTIDLTQDDTSSLSRPQYNHQRYRSTSPSEPDYRQSKFLAEDWIKELSSTYSQKARERDRLLEEAEIKTKIYEEKRKAQEVELEKRIRHDMKLYDRQPAVTEYESIEDIEEEEEEEKDEEEKEEVLPELTTEMMNSIHQWLRPQPSGEVLVEKFRLQLTRGDINTLQGLNWLNDEVINFYMNMLMERGEQEGKAKVYAFNTFFYPKIISGGQSAVKRWTRRVDVFAVDYILIPVHLGMHWCLSVVDFKKKQIQYYDSMGGTNKECLNAVRQYLCDESLDKKKKELDLSTWSSIILKDIPQQMNGSDCGMFSCKYAEYITREVPITFKQEHMPYFRQRMVYEIVKAKLLQ